MFYGSWDENCLGYMGHMTKMAITSIYMSCLSCPNLTVIKLTFQFWISDLYPEDGENSSKNVFLRNQRVNDYVGDMEYKSLFNVFSNAN